MLVNKAVDRQWKATDYAGIERSLFRNNDTGGRSSVVKLARGARFPRHAHEGTEEVVVLAGTVRIGGAENSPAERDRFSGEAAWVAGAVPVLVMVVDVEDRAAQVAQG